MCGTVGDVILQVGSSINDGKNREFDLSPTGRYVAPRPQLKRNIEPLEPQHVLEGKSDPTKLSCELVVVQSRPRL